MIDAAVWAVAAVGLAGAIALLAPLWVRLSGWPSYRLNARWLR